MPEIALQLVQARPGVQSLHRQNLDAGSLREALIQAGADSIALRPDRRTLALGVVAFRNGQDVRHAGGIEAPLAPGDSLLVLIPATDS